MKNRIGKVLGLEDLIKAHPDMIIKGWAEKMKREGGDHPHTWCRQKAVKFASDPDAFCAAVHMEAYGMTTMQRKDKKEKK